ncbi:MAG: hypothetical protein A3C36_00345 [Omnitrophica WOR_2 bacterium RIFCSPHIGHO2_02_FULL_52_10]|nr:MAG: hypothetical protein A3C36_00345 [Omnitrophica WOR_2 bacterium RIFCSPHIGHO2_02_FULL_52_10]
MMKNNSPKKKSGTFTPSQVGALFESLKGDIQVLAEGQGILRKDVGDVRETLGRTLERVTGLEISVTGMKETVALILRDTTDIKKTIADHGNRITRLEAGKL